MADIGFTGATVVAAGWAGRKLLGPVFDEIAEDWRQRYSEHRARNLNRIGRNAQAKVGEAINEPGEVPPRLAAAVMEDGSWCDAEVMAEYFGGILAASRSPDGRDDRGVAWARLVSRLASDDVFLHYLIYEAIRRIHLGREMDFAMGFVVTSLRIYLPASDVLRAMGRPDSDESWFGATESVSSLVREGLLHSDYTIGAPDFLREHHKIDAPEIGLIVGPTYSGIELFLWAHGLPALRPDFIRRDVVMEPVEDLGRVEGARELAVMKQERLERENMLATPPEALPE